MAKLFQISVYRTDSYKIEVDENIINDEWIKNFESYMWDVDKDSPHEDLAKHIGQMCARFGHPQHIEGFGWIPVEGDYFTDKEKESLAKGFKVKVLREDDVIEIDATPLNNEGYIDHFDND